MIADALLEFCDGKSLAAAVTSDVIDLKQEYPNTGSYVPPFVCLVHTANAAGTGSVTFKIQDSADNSTFADAITATIVADDMKSSFAIPMPIKHRRYVRLVTAVDGTASGTFGAVLNNVYDLERTQKVEGYDTVQTID